MKFFRLVTATASALTLCLATASWSAASVGGVGGDSLNTSSYSGQSALTPANLSSGNFGVIFDDALVGKVYAQPLVVGNEVLVVTEDDMAYGINAATGHIDWSRRLGTPATPTSDGKDVCGDIGPEIGVTSTPVVDPATGIAYVMVARASRDDGETAYFLVALSVADGSTPAGWTSDGVAIAGNASNDSTTTFQGAYESQRTGLVLVDGVVYAGFSAQCDYVPPTGTYAGWIVGVDTRTPAISTMWASATQGTNGGGIWQSGGAPVVDDAGNLYYATGNLFTDVDSYVAPTVGSQTLANYGEALVKFSTTLPTPTVTDWFTPVNAPALDARDLDFASGGPVALPQSLTTAATPHVLLQIGKDGTLYALNMDNLGGFGTGPHGGDAAISTAHALGGAWSRPAVWTGNGGLVYITEIGGYSPMFALRTGHVDVFQRQVSSAGVISFTRVATTSPTAVGNFAFGSGSPVITTASSSPASAIMWCVRANNLDVNGAELDAFAAIPKNPGSAGSLTRLWHSGAFTATKFSAPAVSGNRLFVGTGDGHLLGFGILGAASLSAPAIQTFPTTMVGGSSQVSIPLTATTTTTLTAVATTGGVFQVNDMSPVTLAAGSRRSIVVTYQPQAISSDSGELHLTVITNGQARMMTVALRGHSAPSSLIASATPTSLSFANQPIGGNPVTLTTTVTNKSAAAFVVTGASLSTPVFSVTLNRQGTVNPGTSVIATVTFYPPGSSGNFAHDYSDLLQVATSIGTVSIPVVGSASPGAVLAVSPLNLSLGTVAFGRSATVTFTVANRGAVPLTIVRSDPPTGSFHATSTLAVGTVIAPHSQVTETVVFTASTTGARRGTWVIAGDDDTPAQTVVFTATVPSK